MIISDKTNYPILAAQFQSQAELAKLIYCSERTVRRSMSGNRPFKEWELEKIEEYTGIPREVFLRRAGSKGT